MASRVPVRPFTEGDLQELAGAASAVDAHLPQIHLAVDSDPPLRALCFLVRVRSGGFMVAAPLLPQVEAVFQDEDVAEEDKVFACTQPEVQMETVRGRVVGQAPVLLVDAPCLVMFSGCLVALTHHCMVSSTLTHHSGPSVSLTTWQVAPPETQVMLISTLNSL